MLIPDKTFHDRLPFHFLPGSSLRMAPGAPGVGASYKIS